MNDIGMSWTSQLRLMNVEFSEMGYSGTLKRSDTSFFNHSIALKKLLPKVLRDKSAEWIFEPGS